MKLSGLNAIITGANQGLGLAIARAFVEAVVQAGDCRHRITHQRRGQTQLA